MGDASLPAFTAAEQEMMDGYRDGRDANSPEPGPNRSPAYRHGFLNGRDDLHHSPRDRASVLRARAEMILSGAS